jgi:hypothetical protein
MTVLPENREQTPDVVSSLFPKRDLRGCAGIVELNSEKMGISAQVIGGHLMRFSSVTLALFFSIE